MKKKDSKKPKVIAYTFSEETNTYYRLLNFPNDLPCLEISGIRMHCVKEGISKSTIAMVKTLGKLKGNVLDTCFGLGYTAIELAKNPYVDKVFSFEKDSAVIMLARQNPASKAAFNNPKIHLTEGDIIGGTSSFKDGFFSAILHDPPSIKLAGDLYSSSFYRELFRVLSPGGSLFHYTGSTFAERGVDLKKGIAKRLKGAGFAQVRIEPFALGLVAVKPK